MKTRRQHILALLIFLVMAPVSAMADSEVTPTLNSLESKSELGFTRLTLDFNQLPTYELKTSGQRIELRLKDAMTGAGIKRLPEDDKIIKALVAREQDGIVISFLLRRLPVSVLATPDAYLHQLNIAIRWEDEDRVRPGIVFDLPDMPAIRKAGSELKRTSIADSPYRGDWLAFLKKSHTPIKCVVPPRFTFPSLPELPTLKSESSESISEWRELARLHEWQKLEQVTLNSLSVAGQLLHIEARMRQRTDENSLSNLRILKRSELDADIVPRLRYLLAHAQAQQGQFFESLLNLTEIQINPDSTSEWNELALLFQVEIELAMNHPAKAGKALNKLETSNNVALKEIADLRKMDQLAMSGKYEQALEGYATLPVDRVDQHPFSLALIAYCSQMVNNHGKARESFNLLAQKTQDAETRNLARFGELTCYKDPKEILIYFDKLQELRWDTPEAEVAYRVVMKLTDMMVPAQNESAIRQQLGNYQQVSEEAGLMALRQEAAIKVAALHHLLGDDTAAVRQLETTLRDFKSGNLHSDAIALLVEILPSTISQHINEGRNIDALVLVERNRDLLIQQPLSWEFLFQVAQAFDRLELVDRADKIFLYLYDRANTKQRKSQACLLLANNYLKLSEYELAQEYASRYRHFQPEGEDCARSIEIELRARVVLAGEEEALDWLAQEKRPVNAKLALYMAELNWTLQRYQAVIEAYASYHRSGEALPAKASLREAEAFYRNGQLQASLKRYRNLFGVDGLANQARYRAGSILLKEGDLSTGQALLEDVARQQNPDHWSKLAADSLRELTM